MYPAQKSHSQILAFEFIKDVRPTTISYGTRQNMRPFNYVTLFEIGVVHPLGQVDRRLYTLQAHDTIVGLKFRHEALRDGAELVVTDFGFWLRERLPTFEVRVSDLEPFTIGMAWEDNKYHVVLESVESFTAKKTGLAYVPASPLDQLPLAVWGLNDSNTGLENRLNDLYNQLLHAATELVGLLVT